MFPKKVIGRLEEWTITAGGSGTCRPLSSSSPLPVVVLSVLCCLFFLFKSCSVADLLQTPV